MLITSILLMSYTSDRLRHAIASRHGGLTLVLENVRKENVALIARTAECLGIGSLHLIFTPDMEVSTRAFGALSDRAKAATLSKISRSATDWIDIEYHSSVQSCVNSLRADGYSLIATTPPSVEGKIRVHDLYDIDSDDDWALARCALIFGSEAHGLSDELLGYSTSGVFVAQRGLTQSLNVAACAALVLGEVTRRRRASGVELRLTDEEQAKQELALLPDGELRATRMRSDVKQELRALAHKQALKAMPTYVDEV